MESQNLRPVDELRDLIARLSRKAASPDVARMPEEAARDDIRQLLDHVLAMRAQLDRMDARLDRIEGRRT